MVRHALSNELGWRTWYAGPLVAATAVLSICLNIQDFTGSIIVLDWMLPTVPTLYMLGHRTGPRIPH